MVFGRLSSRVLTSMAHLVDQGVLVKGVISEVTCMAM